MSLSVACSSHINIVVLVCN
uniref:Uncharacterized protein n=1 Tax=Rhizophora mucronata TaxID=61149 RepID=A0A2P2QT25_RHIMU